MRASALLLLFAVIAANIFEFECSNSMLVKKPFVEMTEKEKQRNVIEEYLIILFNLQYVRTKVESRTDTCNALEQGLKKNRNWVYYIYLPAEKYKQFMAAIDDLQKGGKIHQNGHSPKPNIKQLRESSDSAVEQIEAQDTEKCMKRPQVDLARNVKCLRYIMRRFYQGIDCENRTRDNILPEIIDAEYQKALPRLMRINNEFKSLPKIVQSTPTEANTQSARSSEERSIQPSGQHTAAEYHSPELLAGRGTPVSSPQENLRHAAEEPAKNIDLRTLRERKRFETHSQPMQPAIHASTFHQQPIHDMTTQYVPVSGNIPRTMQQNGYHQGKDDTFVRPQAHIQPTATSAMYAPTGAYAPAPSMPIPVNTPQTVQQNGYQQGKYGTISSHPSHIQPTATSAMDQTKQQQIYAHTGAYASPAPSMTRKYDTTLNHQAHIQPAAMPEHTRSLHEAHVHASRKTTREEQEEEWEDESDDEYEEEDEEDEEELEDEEEEEEQHFQHHLSRPAEKWPGPRRFFK